MIARFFWQRALEEPRDTYNAIDWALHRANKHSFLQVNRPGHRSELVGGRYGYIHVPSRSGAGGQSGRFSVRRHWESRGGRCVWMRRRPRGNQGGNMWPMLAGVGPLLGDSLVGSFGIGATATRWYYRQGLSGTLHPNGVLDTITQVTVSPVQLRQPNAPVAILIDGVTASAGEDIAIAFRGRPSTRSFGSPSAGYTTINRGSHLPDGASIVGSTGYNATDAGSSIPSGSHTDS